MSDAPHPMHDLARLNAALAGRHVVERELGHGGMATVYRARGERHQRMVALKVLRPDLAAMLGGERFPPDSSGSRATHRIL